MFSWKTELVSIKIDNNDCAAEKLNLNDNLSKIRQILKFGDTKSFLSLSNNGFSIINHGSEKNIFLKEIVVVIDNSKKKVLYLNDISTPTMVHVGIKGIEDSSFAKKLNLNDNLSNIREKAEINDTLLFLARSSHGYSKVKRADEKEMLLKEIVIINESDNIKTLCLDYDTSVPVLLNVKIEGGESPELLAITSNLNDNLIKFRNDNKIDNRLLFLSPNSDESGFSKIVNVCEDHMLLIQIITTKYINLKREFYLHLLKRPWVFLTDTLQLDYGRTMSFDGILKANKRAFIMKDCNLNDIPGQSLEGQYEFRSAEEWMKKTNLFFSTGIDVQKFVRLGMSIGGLKNEDFKNELELSYAFTEFQKASLKLSIENLELTDDFKNDVTNAISSENPREEFKMITDKYGHFISTEIILGGRIYYEKGKTSFESSTNKSIQGSTAASAKVSDNKIGGKYSISKSKSNFYGFKHMKVMGGSYLNENIDSWKESLNSYKHWDCIEFRNPINIFQFLPDDLRKQAFTSIGKRILYADVIGYNILGMCGRFPIPEKINLSKNTDYDIFATVADTKKDFKNHFFNCKIVFDEEGKWNISIHGFQKTIQKKDESKPREIKIGLMIIGYDIEFEFILSEISVELKSHSSNESGIIETQNITGNRPIIGIPVFESPVDDTLFIGHKFVELDNKLKIITCSYDLKEENYVEPTKLPKFNFHTLNIRCPPSFSESGFVDSKKLTNLDSSDPKYFGLHTKGKEKHTPILLSQKDNEIYIEHIRKYCEICNNEGSKTFVFSGPSKHAKLKKIGYRSFDPKIR